MSLLLGYVATGSGMLPETMPTTWQGDVSMTGLPV